MSGFTKQEEYKLAKSTQDIFKSAIQHCMKGAVDLLQQDLLKMQNDNPESSMKDLLIGFQSEGKTLLHVAASSGHPSILECVLEKGEIRSKDDRQWINIQDDRGFTPLMNATISESLESMQRLLDLGADVDSRNKEGASALHFAAADGNVARLQLLCDNGAHVSFLSASGSPLHWAAARGHAPAIRFLLSRGADVNQTNNEGIPVLLAAAASGGWAAVQALVENGADVGTIVSGHLTTLHICAEGGGNEAVASIVNTETGRRCCSVATIPGGDLPIHMAAMSGNASTVLIILSHTPRDLLQLPSEVSCASDEEIVRWLLEDGKKRLARWEAQNQNKHASSATPNTSSSSASSPSTGSLEEAMMLFESMPTPSNDIELFERLREEGNHFYKASKYQEAADKYSGALIVDKNNAPIWSNRSACYMALNDPARALIDAEICRRLRPDWTKACYRQAIARLALKRYEDAAVAAFEGYKIDSSNKELKALLDKAVQMGREDFQKQQQVGSKR